MEWLVEKGYILNRIQTDGIYLYDFTVYCLNETFPLRKEDKNLVILLVEDDPGHTILIEDNLKSAGINRIYTVNDGQKALDFIYRQGDYADPAKVPRPGLILLDISMPGVDGFEVLERIKKDNEYKRIPIVMLTTTDNQDDIDRCYQLGASNYIVKPVDFSKFEQTIRNLGTFLNIVSLPCEMSFSISQGLP